MTKASLFSINILPIDRITGKALLQLRDNKATIKHPGMWSIIGGRSLKNESHIEALRRELLEETGISDNNICPLFFYKNKTLTYEKMPLEAFYYIVYIESPVIVCNEGQAMKFMSREEIIRERKIIPYQKELLLNAPIQ